MRLPTTAYLAHGKTTTAPVKLAFTNDMIALSQARFSGRTMLTPAINLNDYAFKAVIDWIEFQVTFVRITQFRYVQDVLRGILGIKCWVTVVNPGAGAVSDTFIVKIQEPKSGQDVCDLAEALFEHFGKAQDATISTIEVSLDAKPRRPSDISRMLAVGVMQKSIFTTRDIWTRPKSRPRSIKGKAKVKEDGDIRKLLVEGRRCKEREGYLRPEHHIAPWIDATMYLGAEDDDVMIRIMDKVVDRQNPEEETYVALTDTEKRARIEVTLKGGELHALGLHKVSDLKGFAFSKLQGRYFQFKLPTFRTASYEAKPSLRFVKNETERRRAEIFLKTGVVGLFARDIAFRELRGSVAADLRKLCVARGRPFSLRQKGSGDSGLFVAYDDLNRLAAKALRQLGEREARAWT